MKPAGPGDRAARWPRKSWTDGSDGIPRCRVVEMQPLGDGLRNANFKLRLDGQPEPVVLRIYEHEPRCAGRRWTCFGWPAARFPCGGDSRGAVRLEDLPPFTLARYVEGNRPPRPGTQRRYGGGGAGGHSAGETLAAIGRITFARPGWLGPGRPSRRRCWKGRTPRRDSWICVSRRATRTAHAGGSAPSRQRPGVAVAPELAGLDEEARLVHGLQRTQPAGTMLADGVRCGRARLGVRRFRLSAGRLGNFLRYERAAHPLAEPHFFGRLLHAGGALPRDWWRLARVLDLAAVCESLTHHNCRIRPSRNWVELVRATAEIATRNRDDTAARALLSYIWVALL